MPRIKLLLQQLLPPQLPTSLTAPTPNEFVLPHLIRATTVDQTYQATVDSPTFTGMGNSNTFHNTFPLNSNRGNKAITTNSKPNNMEVMAKDNSNKACILITTNSITIRNKGILNNILNRVTNLTSSNDSK